MPGAAVIELDLHGLRTVEAKNKIDAAIKSADPSVYRIRLIHGYRRGTGIKSMIYDEYSYGRSERVVRIEPGLNEGITELVLREY